MKKFFNYKNLSNVLNKKKLYLYGAATGGVRALLMLRSIGYQKKYILLTLMKKN
jgi:hypothetical protein